MFPPIIFRKGINDSQMGEKEQNTRYNWKFYQGKTHTKKKKFPRGKVPD